MILLYLSVNQDGVEMVVTNHILWHTLLVTAFFLMSAWMVSIACERPRLWNRSLMFLLGSIAGIVSTIWMMDYVSVPV